MVFSSVPVYLDPPNYLQQQPFNNQQQGAADDQKLQFTVPPPPPPGGGGGGGAVGITGGSVRPAVSLAERARLAKIPQPEVALKCPRCESTNTKFCYFNNYSLSQPRHFCKTCRRYWTRGGALRNVPVGGGCRRNNKRSKGSGARSKSPVKLAGSAGSSSSGLLASNSCTSSDVIIGHIAPTPPPQLPNILPPYNHLGTHYNSFNDIGLNFVGIQPPVVAKTGGRSGGVEFQIGNNSSSGGVSGSFLSSSGLFEQWRLQQQVQQFPFLTSLDPPSTGLDPFGNGGGMEAPNYVAHQIRSSRPLDSGITTTLPATATVKIEENRGLNLSKKNLGVSGNDQYWGGGNNIVWADNLPGFTSSSTGHLL